MTSPTTISVIIPVHNGADLIARALGSIANQTHPITEVIVVDDGSTDHLTELLASIHFEGRLISRSHNGQGAAINAGIRAARGEFLTFLDHDDEWTPDKTAWQVDALDNSGSHVVVGSVVNRFTSPDGATTDKPMGPARVLGAALIRREAFERVGYFPEDSRTHEIFDWWSRSEGKIDTLIDSQLALIRHVHGGNQTLRLEHRDRRDLIARIRAHRQRHD